MYYRRSRIEGGTYFFTVNLANRNTDLLVRHVDNLRAAITHVKSRHPFSLIAMVALPEHLHAIWRLPPGDGDYATRWALIKAGFSRTMARNEMIRDSRHCKRKRGIWQRRYWEHCIRDEVDLSRHVDYIHFNPVKHGLVTKGSDWPYSTLHGYIARVPNGDRFIFKRPVARCADTESPTSQGDERVFKNLQEPIIRIYF